MENTKFTLSEYQKEELKFVFEMFSPLNGRVCIDTAKQMLLKLEETSERQYFQARVSERMTKSEPNSPDQIRYMGISPFINISGISSFPNGLSDCSFEEFALMYENIMSKSDFEDVLMQTFAFFDLKKTGLIDSKDFFKAAEVLGESLKDDQECKRLLGFIDTQNNPISYKQFKNFFISDIKNDEQPN
jgi:hypothetical protein